MDSQKYQIGLKFVKFNGLLLFTVALFFVSFDLWDLVYNSTDDWDHELFVRGVIFRQHALVRLMADILWLFALLAMYSGLRAEDHGYLRPAKYLFVLEVFIFLAEESTRMMMTNMGYPHMLGDSKGTFIFTVGVLYMMRTLYTLEAMFDVPVKPQQEKKLENETDKVHIVSWKIVSKEGKKINEHV